MYDREGEMNFPNRVLMPPSWVQCSRLTMPPSDSLVAFQDLAYSTFSFHWDVNN